MATPGSPFAIFTAHCFMISATRPCSWAIRVARFRGLLTGAGFDIEAQISCAAAREKMKVAELPCGYVKRVGESKIRAWDTWVILKRILGERTPPTSRPRSAA